jgi:toxin ParE1/3/4
MTSKRFRLSHRAQADLEGVVDFLSERSLAATERVLDTLLNTFELLADNPMMGMNRDDPHLRMFVPRRPAENFVIFYYPLSDGIEVSDVIHAAQDWVGMFDRGER